MENISDTKYHVKLFIDTYEEPSILLEISKGIDLLTFSIVYGMIESELQLSDDKFTLKYFCKRVNREVKMEIEFAVPIKDLINKRLDVVLSTKAFRASALKKHIFVQK